MTPFRVVWIDPFRFSAFPFVVQLSKSHDAKLQGSDWILGYWIRAGKNIQIQKMPKDCPYCTSEFKRQRGGEDR